jgi:hypothetical protein
MKPKLFRILVAILGLFVLWIAYWSGYQSGYVKVKNEQYSTISTATAEKLHFLKVLGGASNPSLKSDIKLSIKGNIAELESMDTYLQKFDGLQILNTMYYVPRLAYLASKLHREDRDRKSILIALKNEEAEIERNSVQGTK